MKKFLKTLLKTFLFLIGLVLLYVVLALVLPLFLVNSKVEQKEEITIYILTNGVHTDIICPIKNDIINWSEIVPFENTLSKRENFEYVAFGWGDKGFYLDTPTWAELKISTALKAAFWMGDSAMHVTFYDNLKEGKDCKKVMISKENYALLVDYIKNSFDYENSKTMFVPTDMVYGKNDAFYDAKRSYNLFFTCNTWANKALKESNQKAALWTATDKGIFRHYKLVI